MAVCGLWNTPPVSSSAAEATTDFRVRHSVCTGAFRVGEGKVGGAAG